MKVARRRLVPAMFTALILFLSVVASGASTGLESVAVTPKETTLVETLVDDDAHDSSPHTDKIIKFIHENSSSDKSFHVQGWRWHTRSLARDVRRLGTLCSQFAQNATINIHDKSLEKAVYHVIQFNMKALHRIEDKTFFPWLRAQLSSVDGGDLAESFSLVMDIVVDQQKQVADAGSQVSKQIDIVYSPSSSDAARLEAVKTIAKLATKLSARIQTMIKIEDRLLVPAIAILVSESKQRALNNRVIFNMGVLDSRLHLVGMHEAVVEQGDTELQLFEKEIPAIPRYMIPRWKRLLYDPQACVLEETFSRS